MTQVENHSIDLHRNQESIQSPSFQQSQEMPVQKQKIKKQQITPYRIIIGVAIFLILSMATYKVYSLASSKTIDQINDAHNKIIQNGQSSSGKDTGSVSGSQTSGGSKSSDKPNGVAKPATKGPISSNTNTGNFEGKGEDGSDDDDDSEEGSKRKKLMNKNKGDGGSTDESQEDDDSLEEDSEEEEENGMNWSPDMEGGAIPSTVGHGRD